MGHAACLHAALLGTYLDGQSLSLGGTLPSWRAPLGSDHKPFWEGTQRLGLALPEQCITVY